MSEDFENGGDKTNFKDVRPESTRSKQSTRMGSQGNLKPTPSQSSILTNKFIQEKMAKDETVSIKKSARE